MLQKLDFRARDILHSRPQRPRSFWSAPRIATSGLTWPEVSQRSNDWTCVWFKPFSPLVIFVPRGSAPFGQHQESRPLARSNTGSPRFTDFPSLCAYSESSLTNLIGSGLNLLCLQSYSKTECRWTWPEGQRSRFLVLIKRSVASGDENGNSWYWLKGARPLLTNRFWITLCVWEFKTYSAYFWPN